MDNSEKAFLGTMSAGPKIIQKSTIQFRYPSRASSLSMEFIRTWRAKMTGWDILQGKMLLSVKLDILRPAEFIVVTF